MIPVAVVAGSLLAGGVVMLVAGFSTDPTPASTKFSTGVKNVDKRIWRVLVAAVVAGVVAFALTGWVVLLAAVPALVVGVWYLLGTPPRHDVELLEALDRWIHTLAATVPTGASIVDAVRISRRTAPAALAGPLDLAVRRLDERWSAREALLAMADEIASPDADAVIAALVLAAERGGTGATATLHALADSTADRLRAAREIETEQAKPRIVVRQVTIITLVVLGIALVVARSFFAPYGTPVGQVVLGCLLAAYLGSLLALRRLTTPRRRERILGRAS